MWKEEMDQEKVVSRTSGCTRFEARRSILHVEPVCWFCEYAQFDLSTDELPEEGICRYPQKQII